MYTSLKLSKRETVYNHGCALFTTVKIKQRSIIKAQSFPSLVRSFQSAASQLRTKIRARICRTTTYFTDPTREVSVPRMRGYVRMRSDGRWILFEAQCTSAHLYFSPASSTATTVTYILRRGRKEEKNISTYGQLPGFCMALPRVYSTGWWAVKTCAGCPLTSFSSLGCPICTPSFEC